MNLTEHFQKTRSFLQRYQSFWFEEILSVYPDSLKVYPPSWIQDLDKLSPIKLWQLDSKIDYSAIQSSSIWPFIEEINTLTTFPPFLKNRSLLPSHQLPGLRQKKAHEISYLIPLLENIKDQFKISHFVDVGGGIGHLSRLLAQTTQIPCLCLDHDKVLQKKGKLLLKTEQVEFISKGLGHPIIAADQADVLSPEEIKKIFSPESFTVGLHTCGPLSLRILDKVIENKNLGVLNFPCCYLKLDAKNEVNLSSLAKENPLSYSTIGLTLASRSHSQFSFEDFLLKEQIKKLRYTLHLLLFEKFNLKGFMGAGNYPLKKYHEGFAPYAQAKLNELNLNNTFSLQELEDFFEGKKEIVRHMFLCNILRWQTGRVLEIHLILDRAIFLQENGFEVELFQLFDENISPRNMGILAISKTACRKT